MQKLLTFFQQKNISVYAIVNDQSFNDTLTKDIISFEKLGPGGDIKERLLCKCLFIPNAEKYSPIPVQ